MSLHLKTVAVRPDGCYSVLLWDGKPFAVSVERTFENNRVVIGNGTFKCLKSYYHKGNYSTFEIIVPGHTRVLFHKGNLETDSEGCVIVGESFGVLTGKTAILNSRGGFEELMALTDELVEFNMEVSGR